MTYKARKFEEKLRLLQIAELSDNVSETCRSLGIPRSSLYAIRKAYAQKGKDGLKPKPRRKPEMPNAFPEDTVAKILEMSRRFPSYSGVRISLKLKDIGVKASASGVRKVWKREGFIRGQV